MSIVALELTLSLSEETRAKLLNKRLSEKPGHILSYVEHSRFSNVQEWHVIAYFTSEYSYQDVSLPYSVIEVRLPKEIIIALSAHPSAIVSEDFLVQEPVDEVEVLEDFDANDLVIDDDLEITRTNIINPKFIDIFGSGQ